MYCVSLCEPEIINYLPSLLKNSEKHCLVNQRLIQKSLGENWNIENDIGNVWSLHQRLYLC